MIFGNTKTKLDYIIELGCKRIDAAIEGVIAKYPTPQAVEIEAQSTDTTEFNQQLRDVRIAHNNFSLRQQQAQALGQPKNLFEHGQQHRGLHGIGCDQVSGLANWGFE